MGQHLSISADTACTPTTRRRLSTMTQEQYADLIKRLKRIEMYLAQLVGRKDTQRSRIGQ